MAGVQTQNGFYVTLQSNACTDLFPDNKIWDFKNRLGSSVTLPAGQWEVALTDISYTFGSAFIRFGDKLYDRFVENNNPPSTYTKVSHKSITTEGELLELLTQAFDDSKFAIVENTFKYEVPLSEGERVVFSPKLSDMLGMSTGELRYNHRDERGRRVFKSEGDFPVFLNTGNTKLFVYCNLARPQFVADVMVPCLRVISYDGINRRQQSHEFIHPHYMELSVSDFDTISINIRNEVGEPMSFVYGNLTVTLRFREKKL